MDKKGQSTGFGWIFALTSLFGLGVLYIVFNYVFRIHLAPAIIGQINSSTIDAATKTETIAGINNYLLRWESVPILLFGVIVIYLIVLAIRKESESTYQG